MDDGNGLAATNLPTDKLSYDSWAALRRAHLELRETLSQATLGPDHARTGASRIRNFIGQAQATGAVIRDAKERRAAQSILDYWSADLASSPDAKPSDYMTALLAQFDPNHLPQRIEQSSKTEEQLAASAQKSQDRSREIIRLAASARLWRDSGRKPGYLLYGDAIAEAAKYRHLDADIAELVEASEAARAAAKKKLILVLATAAFSGVFVTSVLWAVHSYVLPILSDWKISQLKSAPSANKQESSLRLLARVQPWMAPEKSIFDLSRVPLKNVSLRNLRLHAPRFVKAELTNVDFGGAYFPNGGFNGSAIKDTLLDGADLSFAQFTRAELSSTTFAGASLYRASFDKAHLCGVDFTGADLRSASFEGVVMGRQFGKYFKDTAWWLAGGWSPAQMRELAEQEHTGLAMTPVFQDERAEWVKQVRRADGGTFDRASALNGLAWTLATYGIDLVPAQSTPATTPAICGKRSDVPGNALEAAKEALCILETLGNDDYVNNVANTKDTLGYILLQLNQIPEAKDYLKAAAARLETGEVLFRLAVAQFASDEVAEAKENLKKATTEKPYVPSHERQTLKKYLTGEFVRELDEQLVANAPLPRAPADCPPGEAPTRKR
jgi:uncharacterized protein YjbI with pentapeptide repeats